MIENIKLFKIKLITKYFIFQITSKRKRNLEFNADLLNANYTKTWLQEITEDLAEAAAGINNDIEFIDQEDEVNFFSLLSFKQVIKLIFGTYFVRES